MVLAPTHVICALGISLVISKYRPALIQGYLLAAFGALIPDFDFQPALIFNDLGWHRMYLNYWLIPFMIFGIGNLLFPKYRMEVLLFSVGYLSHIILDLLDASLLTLAIIDGILITGIVVVLLFKYWGLKKIKNCHKRIK